MYNEYITLINVTQTPNEYGDLVQTEERKGVFARLASISQTEFYQAQAVGLRPELKFVIADYLDYHNESVVEYQAFGANTPEKYTIIRTYRNKSNEMELTCKRGID